MTGITYSQFSWSFQSGEGNNKAKCTLPTVARPVGGRTQYHDRGPEVSPEASAKSAKISFLRKRPLAGELKRPWRLLQMELCGGPKGMHPMQREQLNCCLKSA